MRNEWKRRLGLGTGAIACAVWVGMLAGCPKEKSTSPTTPAPDGQDTGGDEDVPTGGVPVRIYMPDDSRLDPGGTTTFTLSLGRTASNGPQDYDLVHHHHGGTAADIWQAWPGDLTADNAAAEQVPQGRMAVKHTYKVKAGFTDNAAVVFEARSDQAGGTNNNVVFSGMVISGIDSVVSGASPGQVPIRAFMPDDVRLAPGASTMVSVVLQEKAKPGDQTFSLNHYYYGGTAATIWDSPPSDGDYTVDEDAYSKSFKYKVKSTFAGSAAVVIEVKSKSSSGAVNNTFYGLILVSDEVPG